MYIVEGYMEFYDDVQNYWNSLIKKFGFKVIKIDENQVRLENKKCNILLFLSVEQRIYYFFKNPNTDKEYDNILLYIFFGIKLNRNLVGGKNYPISMEKWVDLYTKDDFRSICLIDLPIIRDEILINWKFLLEGNFSFEKDYIEWEKWYEKKKEIGVNFQELSFEHYKKEMNNTNWS
jgi:hypothetical protein